MTWGRAQMAHAFALVWAQLAAEQMPICPQCGQGVVVHPRPQAGPAPDKLRIGHAGAAAVPLPGVCTALSAQRSAPADRGTWAGDEQADRAGAAGGGLLDLCYDRRRLAAAVRGAVSPEWDRQVVEAHGQAPAAARQQARRCRLAGETEPPPVAASPAQGLVALDGGSVRRRDGDTADRQGTVAVLATGQERIGRHRRPSTDRRSVATCASAAEVATLTDEAAAELGPTDASPLVVRGAGASWISELAAWCLRHVKRRLARWHRLCRGDEAIQAEDLEAEVAATLWATLRGSAPGSGGRGPYPGAGRTPRPGGAALCGLPRTSTASNARCRYSPGSR